MRTELGGDAGTEQDATIRGRSSVFLPKHLLRLRLALRRVSRSEYLRATSQIVVQTVRVQGVHLQGGNIR